MFACCQEWTGNTMSQGLCRRARRNLIRCHHAEELILSLNHEQRRLVHLGGQLAADHLAHGHDAPLVGRFVPKLRAIEVTLATLARYLGLP